MFCCLTSKHPNCPASYHVPPSPALTATSYFLPFLNSCHLPPYSSCQNHIVILQVPLSFSNKEAPSHFKACLYLAPAHSTLSFTRFSTEITCFCQRHLYCLPNFPYRSPFFLPCIALRIIYNYIYFSFPSVSPTQMAPREIRDSYQSYLHCIPMTKCSAMQNRKSMSIC